MHYNHKNRRNIITQQQANSQLSCLSHEHCRPMCEARSCCTRALQALQRATNHALIDSTSVGSCVGALDLACVRKVRI